MNAAAPIAHDSPAPEGPVAMFQCRDCGHGQFQLRVRDDQSVVVETNQYHEIVIRVGQRPPFIADLAFMNRFAICRHCHSSRRWAYWFPPVTQQQPD